MEQIPDIAEILDNNRLVKAHFFTKSVNLFLGCLLAENTACRIAGCKAHDEVNDKRYAEDDRNHGQQSFYNIFKHDFTSILSYLENSTLPKSPKTFRQCFQTLVKGKAFIGRMGLFSPIPLAYVEVTVGKNIDVLKTNSGSIELLVLIQGNLRAEFIDLGADFGDDSGHFLIGTSRSGFLDESVDFRIVDTGLVGSTDSGRMEVHHQVLNHGGGSITADEAGVVAGSSGIEVGGKVHRFNGGVDTDIFEVGQDNFSSALLGVVGADDGELDVSRIAAPSSQIFFGLVKIVLAVDTISGSTGESDRSLGVSLHGVTVFSNLDDGITVDGAVESFADVDVSEVALFIVEVEELEGDGVNDDHLELIIVFDTSHVRGVNVDNEINVTGLKSQGTGGAFGDDFPLQVLDGGSTHVVVFVSNELKAVTMVPADKLISAGADRLLVEVVAGLEQGLGKNEVCMVGEGEQQVGVVTVGGDGDGVLVGSFNRGVVLGVVGDVSFSLSGNHGSHDVFSGHFFTIVELDALTEMESPSAAVFRDFIALSEVADRVEVVVELHHAVVAEKVQVSGDESVVSGRGQGCGFIRSSHDKGVLGSESYSRKRKQHCDSQNKRQDLFHISFSFLYSYGILHRMVFVTIP